MSIAQSHVKTCVTHAGSGFKSVAAIAAAAALVAACAGRQHTDNQSQPNVRQPPPHEIAVQVDNDRSSPEAQPTRRPSEIGTASGPTEIRVYVALEDGTMRQYIGTVPGGQTQTLKFTPSAYGNWYRFIGVTPLGRNLESARFNIVTPETGLVEWSLQSGMINYYNVVTDTTGTGAGHPQPPTSPSGQPAAPSGGNPPSTPASGSPGL
jgi:hypothetical protein